MADSDIISFACASCGQTFEVPSAYAGRSARCKGCGQTVTVPSRPSSMPKITHPETMRPTRARPPHRDNSGAQPGLASANRPPGKPKTAGRSRREPDLPLNSKGRVIDSQGQESEEFDYGPNGTIYYAEPPREDLQVDENDSHFSEDAPSDSMVARANAAAKRRRASNGNGNEGLLYMQETEDVLRLALQKQVEANKSIVAEQQRRNDLAALQEAELARRKDLAVKNRQRLRSMRNYGILTLVLFYGWLVWSGRVADWLVLSPSKEPMLALNEQARHLPSPPNPFFEVWIAHSNTLQGEPEAYVLALCGNDQRAEDAARAAVERFPGRKIEAWAVNYPGFGGTAGSASLKELSKAGAAGLSALRHVAGDKPVIVTGQNIGAAVALSLQGRDVDGMVLYGPAPVKELLLGKFGWYNLWIVTGPVAFTIPDDLDAVRKAATVRVPAVFITPGADSLVPISYQQKIINAYRGDYKVVDAPFDGHARQSRGLSADTLQWIFDKATERHNELNGIVVAPAHVPPTAHMPTPATTQSAK